MWPSWRCRMTYQRADGRHLQNSKISAHMPRRGKSRGIGRASNIRPEQASREDHRARTQQTGHTLVPIDTFGQKIKCHLQASKFSEASEKGCDAVRNKPTYQKRKGKPQLKHILLTRVMVAWAGSTRIGRRFRRRCLQKLPEASES